MNPVQAALANARLQEQEREAAVLTAAVAKRLGLTIVPRDKSTWKAWQAWCATNHLQEFPALPATVAVFILNSATLGIDHLEKVVASISAMHANVADPTTSPLVTAALDSVAPIEPPRSWPALEKARFKTLPRGTQLYLSKRQAADDKLARKLQNEIALLKRKANGNSQDGTATADKAKS